MVVIVVDLRGVHCLVDLLLVSFVVSVTIGTRNGSTASHICHIFLILSHLIIHLIITEKLVCYVSVIFYHGLFFWNLRLGFWIIKALRECVLHFNDCLFVFV